MTSLISILIVNFKAADFLRDCIKSISEQKVKVEVIVVDNASGDYDREMLRSLSKEFVFVKTILNAGNRGFSEANNQALAISRGEYILFLNPDTFLFPSCLERLVSFLKTDPLIGCVIPKLWLDKEKRFIMPPSYLPSLAEKMLARFCRSNRLLLAAYQKIWFKKAFFFWNADTPLTVDAISGAFFMTTREVLNKVGTFDERFSLYFEDSDLCKRIKKAGLKPCYYPQAEAVHYYNQSAKASPSAMQKFIVSEGLYMSKYYNRFALRLLPHLDKLPATDLRALYRPWDFSSRIKTTANSYLLFSPLETMMPCVAHKLTGETFTFDKGFVRKLAKGVYYVLFLTSHGIIYDKLAMEKQ